MSEINKREKGLSEKQFLQLMSSKLKQVLNPTLIKKDQSISSEYSGYFILKTDITEVKDIAFVVNGIGFDQSSNPGIIQFAGYFSSDPTSQDDYLGINKGSSAISEFGFLWVSDKLDILIKTNSASEISAEIFLQDGSDNKNHCIEIIDVDTLDDFDPTQWNTQEFSGESPVNFSFIIKDKDEHQIVINQNVTSATVVDSILNAHEADVLSNDIEITVNADAEAHPYITGTGIIHTSDAEPTAELDLDIELAQFSLAKVAGSEGGGDDEIGGIKLADQNHLPNTKCFPLKLTQSGQVTSGYEQGAYVDLTNFRVDVPASDVHRYSDMDDATEQWSAIGSIVQYIGTTTSDFIHGYYYMRVYEGLLATVGANTNWYIGNPVSGQTTLNSAISQYNKDNDHLLTTSENVIVTPNLTSDATIVDETEFTVVNGAFVDTITYATLKSWGLALADENYDQNTASLWILTLSIAQDTSNPPIWVQKNVQPMAHMQSALTYKGTCTWAELEIKTPISEPGDFYTVTDKSNQEYFFNGVITSDWEDSWEFMGDVFTLNGKYQIKTKVGSSDPVTVSEFEANQPDTTSITLVQGTNVTLTSDTANHTVEIAAIDTTYTASDFDVKDLADTTSLRTTWSNKQDAITAGTGLSLASDGVTINHSNAVTAGTAAGSATKTLTFGDTFDIPTVTYDAQGHVTAKGTTTMTMPANPNTDRYVDQAVFADDSTSTPDNPVKMTLTRAGSDTNTVTANLPKVSSTSAGMAPKGATVSTQTQSTKFLREDGSWAAPSYTTNTDTQADWNESNSSSAAYINNKPSLATVATSGQYSDLSGTPNLATVATSGNYNDLSNKPSIPSVISADDYVTVSGSGGGSGTGIGTYVPVGTVQMYAGEESPAGWLLCDGSNIQVESCTSEQSEFEYNGAHYKACSAGLSPITKVIKNNYSNGLPHAYYVSDPGGLGEGWVKTIQRVLAPTPIVLVTSITADISDAHTDYYTDQTFAKGTPRSYEVITTRQDPCIKIPDLRRKFPLGAKANDTIGINNGNNRSGWSTTIGKTGGEQQHVLVAKELPRTLYDYADYPTKTPSDEVDLGQVLGSAGSATIIKADTDYEYAHNNTPPFLALNFIIKL